MLCNPPFPITLNQNDLNPTPSITRLGNILVASGVDTKGPWQTSIDPVPYDVGFLVISFTGSSAVATNTNMLVDIGIGPSGGGSETVMLPNLLAGWAAPGQIGIGRMFAAPIFIPAGVALSARAQSLESDDTVGVCPWIYAGSAGLFSHLCNRADAYGVNTTGSVGTLITPGSTGAEGSWTNVGSATSRNYDGLVFMAQGSNTDVDMTARAYHFEVGDGTNIYGEFYCGATSGEALFGPFPYMPLMRPVPEGTQLQVRAESSGTAEIIDVALYGLY
jgi:hypothetical protein